MMVSGLEDLFIELAQIFVFSFIFGGFTVLPFFAVWSYLVFRFKNDVSFFSAWISLVIVSAILLAQLVQLVHSSYEQSHGEVKDAGGGPIAPFPVNIDLSVVRVTIPAFSSFLSPLLVVVILLSWKRYRKVKRSHKSVSDQQR